MYRFAFCVIILFVVSCSEPSCPSGYTKYGDTCRRCPPGQERERGQCVSLEQDDDMVSEGGRDLDGALTGNEAGTADVLAGDSAGASDAAVTDAFASDAAAVASDSGSMNAMASDASAASLDGASSAADASAGVVDSAQPDASTPIDQCTPNPCQRGASCSNSASGFACDCPSGSTGDRCELEICGDTTIRSSADLRASRLCAEIRGNLQVATSGFVTIDASDLPNLRKVTGDLRIAALNGSAATPLVQSVTFGSLQVVEGTVFLGGTTPGSVQQVYFPALTTIGKVGDTARRLQLELAPDVEVLELPVLTTIHGSVSVAFLNRLCTLKLGGISLVTGNVSLSILPNLPASTFAPLLEATRGTVAQEQIGCCFTVDNVSCAAFSSDSRSTYCGC